MYSCASDAFSKDWRALDGISVVLAATPLSSNSSMEQHCTGRRRLANTPSGSYMLLSDQEFHDADAGLHYVPGFLSAEEADRISALVKPGDPSHCSTVRISLGDDCLKLPLARDKPLLSDVLQRIEDFYKTVTEAPHGFNLTGVSTLPILRTKPGRLGDEPHAHADLEAVNIIYLTGQADNLFIPPEGAASTGFPTVPALAHPQKGALVSFRGSLAHGVGPLLPTAQQRLAIVVPILEAGDEPPPGVNSAVRSGHRQLATEIPPLK